MMMTPFIRKKFFVVCYTHPLDLCKISKISANTVFLPFCDPRTIKLTQNCLRFTNMFITLIPLPSVTYKYQPKLLAPLHLLLCIASYL